MNKNKRVSCIVPAYNEGSRISKVLKVLNNHPLITELIVVNDGSTDNTKEQIKKFSEVNLISYNGNKGKSYALMRALKKAKYKTVMLIDSDLIGLQKQDITNLLLPVIQDKADLTISLRKNSLSLYKLVGIDFVSGERVFNKKLLGDLNSIGKLKGFGFESFMNLKIIENKQKIKVVNWLNVISPRKSKKFGFFKGALGDLFMVRDIIKTIGFIQMIKTLFQMRSLIVK